MQIISKRIPSLGKDPRHDRARNYGNIIPDADRVELPLDGQRGVGHRTFFLEPVRK